MSRLLTARQSRPSQTQSGSADAAKRFRFSPGGASAYITGTKRIAVLSHAGGAGCSTIAENLAYELSVRLSVKTLLVSMGLPPAAAPHLRLRYLPNLTEYFDRPGKATFQAAIQRRENLEVLLAPNLPGLYADTGEFQSRDRGRQYQRDVDRLGRWPICVDRDGCAFIGGFVDGTFDHLC